MGLEPDSILSKQREVTWKASETPKCRSAPAAGALDSV